MSSVWKLRFATALFASIACCTIVVAQSEAAATKESCAEAIARSSGSHRFRRVGEMIEIPIAPVQNAEQDSENPATECYPVALELHWANGRNQGGIFQITFLDARDQPLFGRQISAFMVGNAEFPINDMGAGKSFGRSMFSIPKKVTIQTREPFGAPAGVSYSVIWIEPKRKERTAEVPRPTEQTEHKQSGNEVVRIRSVERLIGSSRVPLVQIDLKAAQPLPVRDLPLQLRIGKRVFLTELSGDYTGRLLTLSLTPEMFGELIDASEIVAFFDQREGWSFGKLQKSLLNK